MLDAVKFDVKMEEEQDRTASLLTSAKIRTALGSLHLLGPCISSPAAGYVACLASVLDHNTHAELPQL